MALTRIDRAETETRSAVDRREARLPEVGNREFYENPRNEKAATGMKSWSSDTRWMSG